MQLDINFFHFIFHQYRHGNRHFARRRLAIANGKLWRNLDDCFNDRIRHYYVDTDSQKIAF